MTRARQQSVFVRLLLALLIAAPFLVANPPRARAATLVVDTLVDASDGSCTDGDCSLRDAIAKSNNGDIITFSVTGTINLSQGLISIGKSLTIIGPGASLLTVSGQDDSRIFNIGSSAAVDVSLSGLTLTRGKVGSNGGAINNATSGGSLRLRDCVFTDNAAGGFGGAIYTTGSLTLSGCTFRSNTAARGAALAVSYGTAVISRSSFAANSTKEDGGALYAEGSARLEVLASTFSDNASESEGGAISTALGTLLSVRSSRFTGNTAVCGGALHVRGLATVAQSGVYGNAALRASAVGEQGCGGGLYASGTLTLTDSSVYSNTAELGGGLYVRPDKAAIVLNSSFAANAASLSGDNLANAGSLTVANSLFALAPRESCASTGTIEEASTSSLSTDGSCLAYSDAFMVVSDADLALTWIPDLLRLGEASVAIDAGDPAACTARDQLGWPRPADGDGDGDAVCDIGAHELVMQLTQVYLPFTRR